MKFDYIWTIHSLTRANVLIAIYIEREMKIHTVKLWWI